MLRRPEPDLMDDAAQANTKKSSSAERTQNADFIVIKK
jgi:hypothetical protein